jgi:acyl-CoA synthetase (AMP-forming)/AMP-acid ligase II
VRARSIIDVLRERAVSSGDEVAYTFVEDDQWSEVITYRELLTAVQRRAAGLTKRTLPGDRILVILRPGLEYIVTLLACFLARRVAAPAPPPQGRRLRNAIAMIAADCGASLIVCTASAEAAMSAQFFVAGIDPPALWVLRDDGEEDAGEFLDEGPDAADVALLQYTSGSTGSPRGVMVCHGNLIHNLTCQQALYGISSTSRAVIWLPPYHDMGLGSGVLQPLFSRSQIVLMSPLRAMQQPLRWLRCIDQTKATVSGGPPFAFAACVEAAKGLDLGALDLSTWECAFVGAEPISSASLDAFAERFAPHGFKRAAFQASYGLAEATLLVSGAPRGVGATVHPAPAPGGSGRISCGYAVADCEILIVDPELRGLRAEGEEGEIWLRGPSVAAGYWGKADDTAKVFGACLADGRGPFLRTGDLGVLSGGELAVTGRLKDLLIFAGRKVHASDVEATLRGAAGPRLHGVCAAFPLGEPGEERLGILIELRRGADARAVDELRAAIISAVSIEHGVAVHDLAFVTLGQLPRTSSGKVRRHLCRDLYSASEPSLRAGAES